MIKYYIFHIEGHNIVYHFYQFDNSIIPLILPLINLEINFNFFLDIFQFEYYIFFHNSYADGYKYELDRPDD